MKKNKNKKEKMYISSETSYPDNISKDDLNMYVLDTALDYSIDDILSLLLFCFKEDRIRKEDFTEIYILLQQIRSIYLQLSIIIDEN